MRIALDNTGEVGMRAGRILLGDRRVTALGLVDRQPTDRSDGRIERASDLASYDVVASDADDPAALLGRAAAAGTSCVTWVEATPAPSPDAVILTAANLAGGIAPCLASHEVARASGPTDVIVAWTEPGSPLRSGEPLAFPDPVGGRWGRRRGPNAFVAPVAGEWAGAMVRVTARRNGHVVTRIVGVADLAVHLEALALAAGALTVAAGDLPAGRHRPEDAADSYLAEALRLGLDVAAYSLPQP